VHQDLNFFKKEKKAKKITKIPKNDIMVKLSILFLIILKRIFLKKKMNRILKKLNL